MVLHISQPAHHGSTDAADSLDKNREATTASNKLGWIQAALSQRSSPLLQKECIPERTHLKVLDRAEFAVDPALVAIIGSFRCVLEQRKSTQGSNSDGNLQIFVHRF